MSFPSYGSIFFSCKCNRYVGESLKPFSAMILCLKMNYIFANLMNDLLKC